MIGGGIAAAVSAKLNQTLTLLVGVLCLAVATMGEVLSSWFWLTLLISFLSSISMAFINVIISTYLVTRIDEHLIGRVNGTITPLFIGSMLLGSSMAGVLMNSTSIFIVYAISVTVMILGIVPAMRIQFRNDQTALCQSIEFGNLFEPNLINAFLCNNSSSMKTRMYNKKAAGSSHCSFCICIITYWKRTAYSPYPSFCKSSLGTKRSAAELMQ